MLNIFHRQINSYILDDEGSHDLDNKSTYFDIDFINVLYSVGSRLYEIGNQYIGRNEWNAR